MSFPTKEERTKCWNARDKYWDCLDKCEQQGKDKEKENVCAELRKFYENSCSSQWVKHFDRKRNYLVFKNKIEKEGIPNKIHKDDTIEKRRIYHNIACPH